MIPSVDLLRATTTELRCITTEARLILEVRPTSTDVDALRSLRAQFVAALVHFQKLSHLISEDAIVGDSGCLGDAIDLKIGAIALDRAYNDFRCRWLERHVTSNCAEYRLSALRMISEVYIAAAAADRLCNALARPAEWRDDTAALDRKRPTCDLSGTPTVNVAAGKAALRRSGMNRETAR